MSTIIVIIGVLQILGGLFFFANAASAIHEILGSITFGLGVLSVALGNVLHELLAIKKELKTAKD